jgi:hypothetical protein
VGEEVRRGFGTFVYWCHGMRIVGSMCGSATAFKGPDCGAAESEHRERRCGVSGECEIRCRRRRR